MSNIYQHFRPDEKEFIDQVLNWQQFVEDSYSSKLSDFLDPRQIHIVKTIIGTHSQVKYGEFGGYDGAERKRMLLYPDYLIPENNDFQTSLLEIVYPSKFVTLSHRQVLGSLMSIGLKREKFGDILVQNNRIQFIVPSEMIDYVKMELKQIGKSKIQLVELPLNQIITSSEEWKEQSTTVSALRLDAILSSVYPISRQKAQTLIQHGLVKVNWKEVEQVSFVCDEGDVISARGYGRSKIITIEGQTKKDKWRLKVGILK
ncbi:RNA-binding protein [Heyndrickxia shackletonii]|uniref:RNA-binding protein n=1 Tax=Heyndrickxia shackletonii TaxID=157838 RepID=A0A0Q3TL43_9BACI|nr:RNA-binding protein [Heyndrickxia shackletonii]KQL54704.1 RNA-binding protein [Heyndrickxia shackletonii]NEY98356.1 RNA-binding protein [Heyndrickxia shackletonii]